MSKIDQLQRRLQKTASDEEKNQILDQEPSVAKYLREKSSLGEQIKKLSLKAMLAMKQLIAIGQIGRISPDLSGQPFSDLVEKLVAVDEFYRELGGIVGYQWKLLSLLQGETEETASSHFHSPSFTDISEMSEQVAETIHWGIDALEEMAEIYPLGGAADRLHLVDEKTGSELPAAKLKFAGRTLLERLVRDLAGRESLYYKLRGKQVLVPIAIMTSWEKENHKHVLEIAEEHQWFHRPKDLFRLYTQPLVPVANREGDWCLASPEKFLMKPNGHGALWKLARDSGVFSWAASLHRKKALVRQINNPIAGLDYGLLSFAGIGWKKGMKFGFASCPRLLKAAEGVNVLIEKGKEGKSVIVLTNIEYCDFEKFGIEDRPLKEGEPYSRFSSNTNILFADLTAVEEAVESSPFPGLLINLKEGLSFDQRGEMKKEAMARLESTMQNIADVFVEEKRETLATEKTFVTYNQRNKTISTAKKAYVEGRPLQETPENCFYELLGSARDLLEKECGFRLPPKRTIEEYLRSGPECLFLYHPSLGPLYSIIRQKIQKGRLELGSELELEISEALLHNVEIDGSLRILAEQPMGDFDQMGYLRYSDHVGRCILRNVRVENRGICWENSRPFWKGAFERMEGVEIVLKGRSEFVAENVRLEGNLRFVVEDGMRLCVVEKLGQLSMNKETLKEGSFWNYRWERGVLLEKSGE